MKCTSCGLCEPYNDFYWCDYYKTDIHNPKSAGCEYGVDKEEHDKNASETPLEKMSNKISYE